MTEKISQTRIDNIVSTIIAADMNNEIDCICLSMKSVCDGILSEYATIIASGGKIASDRLQNTEGLESVEWIRNDMITYDVIYLWVREGC